MFWQKGWLFNSLLYNVEKDIQDTLYRNETFKSKRWSFIEQFIIWGSKHFFVSNSALFTIALAIAFIFAQYEPLHQFATSLQDSKLIPNLQSNIFVAQVTMLGLLFPLMIAVISIFLQGKPSNEAIWVVYQHNSGFVFASFSALFLIFYFVIFNSYTPGFIDKESVSISIIIWFLFNLCLSGRFLKKTLQFLLFKKRMGMFAKYVINDVIVDDIRKRLFFHYDKVVSDRGFLLKSKDGKFKITTVLTSEKEFRDNPLTQNFSKPKRIKNIWYRLLKIGVWLWTKQACHLNRDNNIPVLYLPLHEYSQRYMYEGKILVLAKTNSSPINCLSAFLIRKAFRMTAKDKSDSPDTKQMIRVLFSQIDDAIKNNDLHSFESAKDNLTDSYKKIESSMYFINSKGEPDSWLLLPDEKLFFGDTFLEEFINEATSIAKTIIKKIHDDANYFKIWIYLYINLFSNQQVNRPNKITEEYINGHYHIWIELMSWMDGTNSSDQLVTQQIERIIKHFVSSWELWRVLLKIGSNTVDETITYSQRHHLECSSYMLICAINHANYDAARWAADVLANWQESNNPVRPHYGWHNELITPVILQYPNGHKLRLAVFSKDDLTETQAYSEASSIALKNYWTDMCCFTAAYLMSSSRYNATDNYKKHVDIILKYKRLDPTGREINRGKPLLNTGNFWGIYLRQTCCWEDQDTGRSIYAGMLDNHLKRMTEIEEHLWVTGRFSSVSTIRKEDYLPLFYKVVGVGLAKPNFVFDKSLMDFLKSGAFSHQKLNNLISSLSNLMSIDDSLIKTVCSQSGIKYDEAMKRRDLFIESVRGSITDLETRAVEQIVNAPIDQQRLIKFGESASGSTFTLSKGTLPICLFQDIEYLDNFAPDLVQVNIVDYPKSEVSEGLERNRAIDNLNNIVKQRVSIIAFQQLLKKLTWKETAFENTLSLIMRAVENSKSIENPIMFVGSWSVYDRIDASKWQYGREEDRLPFDISVESGKAESYICHLAGIEIHKFPQFDFSILLPMEAFKKIDVKHFGDGRYVNVTFMPTSDTDLTGTLSLSFGIECEYQAKECFKYISSNPDKV